MSVGNLFDLGPKPYQDLNVDDITCNELTAQILNIDVVNTDIIEASTVNTDFVRVNTIEPNDSLTINLNSNINLNGDVYGDINQNINLFDNLFLRDIPSQNNNSSQVLVRDFNSGLIQERLIPIPSSITKFARNDALLTTSSEIYSNYLNMNFVPTVSGYYSFDFKVQLGTTAVNRSAFVVFRFPLDLPPSPLVEVDDEFGKPQDVIAETWTSITDTGITFLTANISYNFTILYRAGPLSTARIQRGVIYVNLIS